MGLLAPATQRPRIYAAAAARPVSTRRYAVERRGTLVGKTVHTKTLQQLSCMMGVCESGRDWKEINK